VNFKQLHHLIALADEGRFVAAAERVHLSQPAFSRSIQALETHFGLRLFDRGPNGVALTPAGQTLVARVRGLLFESRCIERDAELLRQGAFGELRFGAGPIPAAMLVPRLLQAMRQRAPQLVVGVRSGNVSSLLTLLEAEEIDFFLGDPRMLSASSPLQSVPLTDIHGALYAGLTHPLLQKTGAIRPNDLRPYGIGMMSASPVLRRYVAQSLGFAEAEILPLAVECDDLTTLAGLALGGDLLSLLPDALAATHAGLRKIDVSGAPAPLFSSTHAIWLSGRTLAPSAELALAECRTLALALGPAMPAAPDVRC
jgi:DNA-binding transcriptional LysR family regulator